MPSEKISINATLEGFGLGDYEAKAYVALLKNGPLLVGELAYHSGIPRTKSYSTIKSLVRKKIVSVTPGKPVRCQAVPPEDCLEKLVSDEEKKVKGMRKTIVKLRHMMNNQKPIVAEEGRHLIISSNAIATKLTDIISSARHSLHCVVDSWGVRLLENAREGILNASINEIEVKVVIMWSPNEGDWDKIPGNSEVRVGKHAIGYNVFLLDEQTVLVVNSNTGIGLLIQSRELHSILERNLFCKLWDKSVPIKDVSIFMAFQGGEDVLGLLVRDEVNGIFAKAVAQAVTDEDTILKIGSKFIQMVEQELHVDIFREPIEVALPLLTTLLLQSLEDGSSVRYDPVTKLLTVESSGSSTVGIPESVWMFAIAGLLNKNQTTFTILQNKQFPAENTHILQAKISRM
jgi:sugar-specific transcriptional regulator TrmB